LTKRSLHFLVIDPYNDFISEGDHDHAK
jgi:hypothetical protein